MFKIYLKNFGTIKENSRFIEHLKKKGSRSFKKNLNTQEIM